MRLCSWFITYLAILGGACSTIKAAPTVLYPPTTTANQSFGRNIIGTSDFSGDGKADLYVSAAGIGQVFVVNPLDGAVIQSLVSPNYKLGSVFGNSMALMPDMDGDGRTDLLVGASGEDTPLTTTAGRAYLYASTNLATPFLSLSSPNSGHNGNFGGAVLAVPDMNGDHHEDIAVGASDEKVNGLSMAGRVYFFSGTNGSLIASVMQPTVTANVRFGLILHRFVDLSGDHVDEILIVAGTTAYILDPIARTYIGSFTTTSNISSLLTVPDADNDGCSDLLMGLPFENVGSTLSVGKAALYSGATTALIRSFPAPVALANALFGATMANVGDRSGDGKNDYLIGAVYQKDIAGVQSGAVYFIDGITGELIQGVYSPAPTASGMFGYGISTLSDLDGDGGAEIAIGAMGEKNGTVKTGKVYIFRSAEPFGGDPIQVYDFNESSLDLARWSLLSGTMPTLATGQLRLENSAIATTQLLGGQPVVVEMTGVSYASTPSTNAKFRIGFRFADGVVENSPTFVNGFWYESFSYPIPNGSMEEVLGSYLALPTTRFDLTLIITKSQVTFFKNGDYWGSSNSALSTTNGPFQVYLQATNGAVLTVDKIVTINGDQANLAYRQVPGLATTPLHFGDTGIDMSIKNLTGSSYLHVEKLTGTPPNLPARSIGYYWSIEGLPNRTYLTDLIINYDPATLTGLVESSLALYRSHDGGLTWSLVPMTLDTDANQVTVHGISQFSLWALAAQPIPAAAHIGWSLYQ